MIPTYCEWHLGDNLIHANWLRRVAARAPSERFVHAARAEYLQQLREVVEDLPNIELVSLNDRPPSVNVWKNRRGDFYDHPLRDDWVAYHLEFFAGLARDLGVENPAAAPDDLLFDFPRLRAKEWPKFDFLVINSIPMSGQFRGYDIAFFDIMIAELRKRGSVIVTGPSFAPGIASTLSYLGYPLTVADIGALSIGCKHIIGVPTGPIWTTFNVWNRDLPRILFLDREYINLTPGVVHVKSIGEAMAHLP